MNDKYNAGTYAGKTANNGAGNSNDLARRLAEIDDTYEELDEDDTERIANKKEEEQQDPTMENANIIKARRKKYIDLHKLDASQTNPANMKYVNFKQDYVVIIRKKPFYASTAAQMRDKNGQPYKDHQGNEIIADDNYLRAYQINNFQRIQIHLTVNGKTPGTCNVNIKGEERVICAENEQQNSFGWFNWNDLVGGWLNIDEGGTIADGTGVKNADNEYNKRIFDSRVRQIMKERNIDSYDEAYKIAQKDIGKSWKTAESTWQSVKDRNIENGTTFRTLFKTREAKYGWRFAEKCDWEPMDEILVFGKSRSERQDDSAKTADISKYANFDSTIKQSNESKFKMVPLFFGYIETVTKSYNAKNGSMIQISAKDHLKLLEVSYCCTKLPLFSKLLGAVDIRWTDAYGMFKLAGQFLDKEPDQDKQKMADTNNDKPQKAVQNYPSMSEKFKDYLLDNILAGQFPDEAIQMLCTHAGIPEKFLTQRIEPFHGILPFQPETKQKSSDVIENGKGETKTRHSLCCEVAARIMCEFFADEAGNIVLKIPNYTLGANLLKANCGGISYLDDIKWKKLPQYKVDKDAQGVPIVVSDFNTGVEEPPRYEKGDPAFAIFPQPPNSSHSTQKTDGPQTIIKKGTDNSSSSSSGSSSSVKAFEDTHATVTDNVVEDILNVNNEIIQLDNYRIQTVLDEDSEYNSLYALAKRYYGDAHKWKIIAKSNNIKDPSTVLPGTKLIITFDDNISDYIISSSEDVYDDVWLKQKLQEWNNAHTDNKSLRISAEQGYTMIRNAYQFKQRKQNIEEDQAGILPYETAFNDDYMYDPNTEQYVPITDINQVDYQALEIVNEGKRSPENNIIYPPLKDTGDINTQNGRIAAPTMLNKSTAQIKSELLKQAVHASNNIQNIANKAKDIKYDGSVYLPGNKDGIKTRLPQFETQSGKSDNYDKQVEDLENKLKIKVRDENAKNKERNKFLSGRTDPDILTIKPEYIISFTLQESDKEVYNYFQIGREMFAFGKSTGMNEDGSNSNNKAGFQLEVIPWMDNILQYGLRVHPGTIMSPWAMDAASQTALGVMLTFASQANKFTATLQCIDDPSVRVGDPIRFHIYDEYPIQNAKYYISEENEKNDKPDGDVFDEKEYPEQAVFYVVGVDRSIDPSNVSTMTLQLRGGRKMGKASVFDMMSLMYNFWYWDWQARGFYEKNGGNNTAVHNPHALDIAKEEQEHRAYWSTKYTNSQSNQNVSANQTTQTNVTKISSQQTGQLSENVKDAAKVNLNVQQRIDDTYDSIDTDE